MTRILRKLSKLFSPPKTDNHFYELKAKDQKRLIETAAAHSNIEQKELLDEYAAHGHPRTS
ncbi:hypothetical protein HJC99_05285 [Candidatus Saccharibacteria bacterium]|nr:hypothetical protein [Candidatus Saccharibacteria bacterium]